MGLILYVLVAFVFMNSDVLLVLLGQNREVSR